MKPPADYLEATKLHEVASELEAIGYAVTLENGAGPHRFDLTATKDGKRLAVEVKAQSRLKESGEEIRKLRRQAREEGYTEFRLVVVNPPREKKVDVDDFGNILFAYTSENLPANVQEVSSFSYLEDINNIEIEVLHVSKQTITVKGTAMAEVKLKYGNDNIDGFEWDTSFPLSFDLDLDHHMSIQNVRKLEIDTSSLYE
jgi:hypothetical protein